MLPNCTFPCSLSAFHRSALPKHFSPQTHWLYLTKGFLSWTVPLLQTLLLFPPRLCNSCSLEPYPKRVMIGAFLFQSVFLEQMAKGELGSQPRPRWGMCQFL